MEYYSICEQCEYYEIFSKGLVGNCTYPLNFHFIDGVTGKKHWKKSPRQLNYKANCKNFKQKIFKNKPLKETIKDNIMKNKFEIMDI